MIEQITCYWLSCGWEKSWWLLTSKTKQIGCRN